MPTWAVILTVTFSGIIAIVTIINILRSASKDGILRLEARLANLEAQIGERIEQLEGRIDKRLTETNNRIDSVRVEANINVEGIRLDMNQRLVGIENAIRDVRTEISQLNQNHIDHLTRHNERQLNE